MVQCVANSENGTVPARNGKADVTTTRLIALLRMTASRAAKRNAPISNGKRNSAPPESDQSSKRPDDSAASKGGNKAAMANTIGLCLMHGD